MGSGEVAGALSEDLLFVSQFHPHGSLVWEMKAYSALRGIKESELSDPLNYYDLR